MRKVSLLTAGRKTVQAASSLSIALKKIESQKIEHRKITSQLIVLNKELQEVVRDQNVYIKNLNKILVMISHNLRQPIAHILGLCNLFSNKGISKKEQSKIAGFMKDAVSCLDNFTKELNAFVQLLIIKFKKR